jgi:uncharacterized protein YabN with tetrapyrrole methylase and pyrophosphatase domain
MLVNISRFLDVDPEEALRKTISKVHPPFPAHRRERGRRREIFK